MTTIYSWTYTIALGYNNLVLPQPVQVSKGYFIQLIQVTGIVSIDISGNASVSDLVWNTTTQWTQLAEFSNWRFYLTTINNFTSYVNSFSIQHKYANIGLYSLSLTFLSSNLTFQQLVNITDCKILYLLILTIILI